MTDLATLAHYDALWKRLQGLKLEEVRDHCRNLCRLDLFFLLRYGCGLDYLSAHPWWLDRCREVQAEPDGMLDLWARGHGKAIATDCPVPTPDGFKNHGDLGPGDTVYGSSGTAIKVVARTDVLTEEPCMRVSFSDGSSVTCSANHLWPVLLPSRARVSPYSNTRKKWRSELLTATQLRPHVEHSRRVKSRPYPTLPPVVPLFAGNEITLPCSPYVLGFWLGDGSCGTNQISCGSEDVDRVVGLIQEEGCSVSVRKDKTAFRISVDPGKAHQKGSSRFTNALRSMRVLKNKRIPSRIFRSAFDQRLALLQGMMDSDGFCHKKHSQCLFANANYDLARDFWKLSQTLGLNPTFGHKKVWLKGKQFDAWHVMFQGLAGLPPFRLPRKLAALSKLDHPRMRRIVDVQAVPSVPVSCIQVDSPDGVYLIGENFLQTHNSTVVTFGKTIQDILASHGEDPLPEWGGQEPTICILSHVRPIAKGFLRQIKMEFETNRVLKEWFPDVLHEEPRKEAPKWSEDDGIIVKRRSNPREATVEAYGLVDGMPTSKHFHVLVYDDVVTERSVTTADMIAKTTVAVELSRNLGMEGTRRRYVGTRYDLSDSYVPLMERGAAKPRLHPATHDGTASGRPVFLTSETWEKLKQETSAFILSCQQLLNPVPDTNAFFRMVEGETLNWYDAAPAHVRSYGATDGAVSKGAGDWTVHGILSVDENDIMHLREVWRKQEDSDVWVDAQMDMVQEYRPIKWVGEAGPIEKAVGPFRRKRMVERKVYYTYETLPSITSKEMRAASFQARWNQGRVRLPRGAPWVPDFLMELRRFPNTQVDDQVDMVSLFGRMLDELEKGYLPPEPRRDMRVTSDGGVVVSSKFVKDQIKLMQKKKAGMFS